MGERFLSSSSYGKPGIRGEVGTTMEVWKLLFYCIVFLGPQLRHKEVPKRGVELELYQLAYTTAT